MDKQLLDILVCPATGAAVAPAEAGTLSRLNAAIEAGRAHYADGSPVDRPLQAALITADGITAYRVDDDLPVMLPERGIDLSDAV
ncbi:hypothetical protein SAOR_14790 [Salinisphaera orenii MK-B5]|uniref:Trm112 family protein n=2 Tax=Salinisphaera orenii TaxID=856731 RepID=A0A423PFN5_9GAMM|nr:MULTISPECIES: Trm112 family protein [Salinisphaera]ROO24459.1 hypothetical protein SAOR_14790 [Salinisphaera orenii MK-B5]ROO28210.1 hypothetical protein SAHL_10560 [Salinisphaera halophila YIM 95161]